jgi:hypothetical protein
MSEWIAHKHGHCPIPDAKAGEWEYKTIGGTIVATANWDAIGYPWEEITHYRLIKPDVDWQEIADDLADALEIFGPHQFDIVIDAIAKYQKAKGN